MAVRWLTTARSDIELVGAARDGDDTAFAELWTRHVGAATRFVRGFSSLDADDVVAEAYTRILTAIRAGKGPRDAFRPYLYATVRNVARSWGSRQDPAQHDDPEFSPDPRDSGVEAVLERSITVKAFRALPERWQHVLWYTEVEGLDPHQVAPLFGVSASGAASLAHRARVALRDAWVQAHISERDRPESCRRVVEQLARYSRDALSRREHAEVEAHLSECVACTVIASEIGHISSKLTLVLVPLFLGAGGVGLLGLLQGGGAPTPGADASVAQIAAGSSGSVAGGGAAAGGAAAGGAAAAGAGLGMGAIAGIATASVLAIAIGTTAVVGATGGFTPSQPAAEAPAPVATPDTRTDREPAPKPSETPATPVEPPENPSTRTPPSAPPAGGKTPVSPPAPAPATAPTATVSWDANPTVRPGLGGTAEPGATVRVSDDRGAVLAEIRAGADGRWSTGPLASVEPTVTALTVVQIRPDATVSPATVVSSLRFTPVAHIAPGGEILPTSGTNLNFEMIGWAGMTVQAVFRAQPGTTANWTGPTHVITIGLTGTTGIVGPFTNPGSYELTLRYLDSQGNPGPESAPVVFTRLP